MHDVVALLEDVPARHFESRRPLLLHRGQIGTVVMTYEDGAVEVEFADRDGRADALLPIQPDKLSGPPTPQTTPRRDHHRVTLASTTYFQGPFLN